MGRRNATESPDGGDAGDAGEVSRVACHLDELLLHRDMTLTELAGRVGMSVVNLSILKNNRAKAVRFSTLTRLCDVLGCSPGDLFSVPERAGSYSGTASGVTERT